MILSGSTEIWTMVEIFEFNEDTGLTGFGFCVENIVVILFLKVDSAILRLYKITGGNFEGRWLSGWWTELDAAFGDATGIEELFIQKIY